MHHSRVRRHPSVLVGSGLLTVAGFSMLLVAAWRWRRRTLPFDPYIEVKR